MRSLSNKPSGHTASGKHAGTAAGEKHPRRAASRARTGPRTAQQYMPLEGGAGAVFDPDLRHRMISEAAYYLHSQRGCANGYDVDDWLQAEAQVDDLILNPDREDMTEVTAPLASP
jgi:hypothetical protein